MKNTISIISSIFLIPLSLFSVDFYWVGNSGNWSDFSNHWATTSGGSQFHARTPGPFDNTFFDQNSFLQTNDSVILDIDANTKNIKFNTGLLANLVGEKKLTIYGNLEFDSVKAVIKYPGGLFFEGTDSMHTVDFGYKSLKSELYFLGTPSIYSFNSELQVYGGIELKNASIKTNSFNIKAYFIRGNNNCHLYLGNSVLDFSLGGGSMTALYIHGGTSHIFASRIDACNGNFHDLSLRQYSGPTPTITLSQKATFENIYVESNSFLFDSGEQTVNGNLTILDGNLALGTGIQNLNSIKLLGLSESLIIDHDTVATAHYLNGLLYLNPSPSGITTLKSTTDGKRSGALITNISDSICYKYLKAQDFEVSGASHFIADNSINKGNNQGIAFGPCQSKTQVSLSRASVPTFGNCLIGDTINDRLTLEAYHSAGSGTQATTYKMPAHGSLIDHNNGSYSYVRQSSGRDSISMHVNYKIGTQNITDTIHWVINDTASVPGFISQSHNSSNETIHIFPNPFLDKLTINDLAVGSKLFIYDNSGKEVMNKYIKTETSTLDLEHLHSGMYVVLIQEIDNLKWAKIIKE